MPSLPLFRSLARNRFLKPYLSSSTFPCERCTFRYYSSKDVSRDDLPEHKSEKNDQIEKEKDVLTAKQDSDIHKNEVSSDKPTKDAAKKKLFSLLSEIKITSDYEKIKPNLKLSKPLKRPKKTERFQDILKEKKSPEEKMQEAISAVAQSIGGNTEETKLDINKKLSSINLVEDSSENDKQFISDNLGIDEKFQESLMSSVKDIASTVSTPIKSKLTQRLLKLSIDKKEDPETKISIKNMMKGMKIEQSTKTTDPLKKELVDTNRMKKEISPRSKPVSKVKLYQSPPLDIFSLDTVENKESQSAIWQGLENKRLKLLTEFAPANAFEEMITWTEQGKHWKFPIDNEIEIGPEGNVGFHEHVFLEQHLKGFPTKGPIRHFMELVAVGLSKNPYITVERKIENIEWFREYFKEKEDILKEYGAI